MKRKERVVVAMSGGVDSAVAAGLLARAGYDVIGITMRLWTVEDADAPRAKKRCCSVEDTDDARRAADVLGIPHYVLNMEREFHDRVIDYFVAEYGRGRTPNPCLACNEHVKFRALLDRALALDADFLATGHYARIEHRDGRYALRRAVDESKDQSYVLYTLGQAELAKTLFPVGDAPKRRIREMAREMKLELAEKPDSADICFRWLMVEWQQAGISPLAIDAAPPRQPMANSRVLKIALRSGDFDRLISDAAANVITIGSEDDLMSRWLIAEHVNWLAGTPPAASIRADVKIRYRAPAAAALVTSLDNGSTLVEFDRRQRAITPGQAAVFYDGDEVIGGGAIREAVRLI